MIRVHDLPDLIALGNDVFPGECVKHKSYPTSFGIVVSRCWGPSDKPMQITVMWTCWPKEVGDFGSMVMPLIRRVQPSLIANELVSVQPMTLPAGLIFYLDYTYGSGSLSGSK